MKSAIIIQSIEELFNYIPVEFGLRKMPCVWRQENSIHSRRDANDMIDMLGSVFSNIIVSGFAIHHQTDDRKKVLYSDIYELLKEVGIFLNHDQVSSETSSISEFLTVSFFGYLSRIPIKMK